MSVQQFNSFHRVFPRSDYFKGRSLRILLWATVGGLLLALLLGCVFLIFSVLEGRGTLVLPKTAVAELSELAGHAASEQITGEGILPAVWASRGRPHGPLISWLYRNVSVLQSSGTALVTLVVFGITVAFFRTLVVSRITAIGNNLGFETASRLRKGIHRQNLRLSPGNLNDTSSQRPFELFTNDCDQIRDGIAGLVRRVARYAIDMIVLLVVVWVLHPLVAMQCIVPLAFFWYLIYLERQRLEAARVYANQQATQERNQLATGLRKTRLVRGFGMNSLEKENFQAAMDRLRKSVAVVKTGETWLRWTTGMLVVVCGALMFCLMGFKILMSPIHPQSLAAASAVTMVIGFSLMHFPLNGFLDLRKQREHTDLAASNIYRYLDQIPEVGQAVGAKFLQPMTRVIQFESVGYSIPNHGQVLKDFDLKIPAGEVVALISLNPLEAQAVASLLPRFIEPNSGRVLYDGEDIAWVTLESLRAETAFVSNSDSVIPGTVLQNLTCGTTDYSLQQATDAARMTHAHNFVINLPNGYETVLGCHGEQLDAGQEFRLALGRAVLRNPAIMIIEEPQEKLDDDTKSWIEDAYTRIARDRTVIFLPTRLSTVRKADRIVVIHNGKVEAIGSHEALVKSAPVYRHWEYANFNAFRSESIG